MFTYYHYCTFSNLKFLHFAFQACVLKSFWQDNIILLPDLSIHFPLAKTTKNQITKVKISLKRHVNFFRTFF